LKECGFLKRKTVAEVDWDAFARHCSKIDLACSPDVLSAIEYIYAQPPQKQVVEHRRLQFMQDNAVGRSNNRLLVLLRRIRNNLFHGAKVPYTDRDESLVIAGLLLIERLLELNPKVAEQFTP
jgi:hypothetical protein